MDAWIYETSLSNRKVIELMHLCFYMFVQYFIITRSYAYKLKASPFPLPHQAKWLFNPSLDLQVSKDRSLECIIDIVLS